MGTMACPRAARRLPRRGRACNHTPLPCRIQSAGGLGFVYLPLSKLLVPNPPPVYTYASSPFKCDCARGSCLSGYLSGIPTLIPHVLDPTLYFHACLYGSRSLRGPGLLIYSSSRLLLALLFNERTRVISCHYFRRQQGLCLLLYYCGPLSLPLTVYFI